MRLETQAEVDRFWSRVVVDETSDCWVWVGSRGRDGYGRTRVRESSQLAHRVAFATWAEPLRKGLQLDHLCRVRSCINPKHLEQVTARENVRRGVAPPAVQAKRTVCVRGHPLNGPDARLYAGQAGKHRQCIVCRAIRDHARYRRRKGLPRAGSEESK